MAASRAIPRWKGSRGKEYPVGNYHPLHKTQRCMKFFEGKGFCPYGESCMFAHTRREQRQHLGRLATRGCRRRSRRLRVLWLQGKRLTKHQVEQWAKKTYGPATVFMKARGAILDFDEQHRFEIGTQLVQGTACTIEIKKRRRSVRRRGPVVALSTPEEPHQEPQPQEGSPPQEPQEPPQGFPHEPQEPPQEPQAEPPYPAHLSMPQAAPFVWGPQCVYHHPMYIVYGQPPMMAPPTMAPQMVAPPPPMMAPQMMAPQMVAPQMMAPQLMAPQMVAPPPPMMTPQMVAPQMVAPVAPPPLVLPPAAEVSSAHDCRFMRVDTRPVGKSASEEPVGFWRKTRWFQSSHYCQRTPLYNNGFIWGGAR